jgi:putative transcriptional regulator
MPIIKVTDKLLAAAIKATDWSKIDSMTDRDIARQIKSNPDAAPDQTAALKAGLFKPPVKPAQIKAVRRKTGLSQTQFAARLHLHVATIRNWEQGRTRPDGAALTLLTVIDRAPKMVMKTLQDK